ncbi:MAG TPA: hypothetical protein VIA19_00360 [Burkholderiales bacterium]|jgi:hypothetical protein
MTAIRVRRRRLPARAAASGGEPRLCGCGLRVDEDERLHLIKACAFFRAERFRAADPATIRGEDVRKAAREVDSVLKGRRKSKKR